MQNPGRPTEKEGRNAEIVSDWWLLFSPRRLWVHYSQQKRVVQRAGQQQNEFIKNQCEIALFKSAEVS